MKYTPMAGFSKHMQSTAVARLRQLKQKVTLTVAEEHKLKASVGGVFSLTDFKPGASP